MKQFSEHTFHIPVMGIAFTVDTPVKIARFGISSVISIVEDNLIEEMRKFYSDKFHEEYIPIKLHDHDHRARRITAYLNLINKIVSNQVKRIKSESFAEGGDLLKYFELLPDESVSKKIYNQMKSSKDLHEKISLQAVLRRNISAGSIDVNIMTKCDKTNYSKSGEPLPQEYSDAMAALRGFAKSELRSSVVFSAGMNPRLYSYCETFKDFYPDENEEIKKKIILKVSDFRSAIIQGRFLAKKGLWVSEFRIESGLNCGGHAFATQGNLMGPILEEFKNNKETLAEELFDSCNKALAQKQLKTFSERPELKISVQGGIGTSNECNFLLNYYKVNSTGWGSPFLLVPEVTNVDDDTLQQLINAKKEDYYLSDVSPLGVPFNNFRKSSGEIEKYNRIKKRVPGSPCYNKYLAFNTEFTGRPICTASRQYQKLKIENLKEQNLSFEKLNREIENITDKECICQGLGTSVFLKNKIAPPHKIKSVSICPGPNLAYFSQIFTLSEMVDHIYGRKNILNKLNRENMFINELIININYLKKEINKNIDSISEKQITNFEIFRENLIAGIEYYKKLARLLTEESIQYRKQFIHKLEELKIEITKINIPVIA